MNNVKYVEIIEGVTGEFDMYYSVWLLDEEMELIDVVYETYCYFDAIGYCEGNRYTITNPK